MISDLLQSAICVIVYPSLKHVYLFAVAFYFFAEASIRLTIVAGDDRPYVLVQ